MHLHKVFNKAINILLHRPLGRLASQPSKGHRSWWSWSPAVCWWEERTPVNLTESRTTSESDNLDKDLGSWWTNNWMYPKRESFSYVWKEEATSSNKDCSLQPCTETTVEMVLAGSDAHNYINIIKESEKKDGSLKKYLTTRVSRNWSCFVSSKRRLKVTWWHFHVCMQQQRLGHAEYFSSGDV